MYPRVLYFFLCCVILDIVWLKPLQVEENDADESDETEYEVLNEAPASNEPERVENNAPVADDFSNQRMCGDSRALRHQTNKHYDDGDLSQNVQYANSRDTSNYEVDNAQSIRNEEPNKRTVEFPASADEDRMLFKENGVSKIDNKYNNNEGLDTSEQAHFFKQYHNTMQTGYKRGLNDQSYENKIFGQTRERREARETTNQPNDSKKNLQDTDELQEEIVIRDHIKKLSDTELRELLNSLTDDKRRLLKKIIDDSHTNSDAYENINKREITKKSGALEENNLFENSQSELSKVQPSSSSADENTESSESTNVERTTLNKQTESPETGSTNSDNKVGVSSTSELNQVKPDKLNSLSAGTDSNNQLINSEEPSKCDNKRETNYNDFFVDEIALEDNRISDNGLENDNSPESAFDQEYVYAQEEMTQLSDDKVENQKGDYKREAYSVTLDDLPDSLKSLEESFPNSNAYSNSASYSGALVRVKRKNLNHNMKKRSADVLPHSKIGYYKYRSESEDTDNDEGNEFHDDRFLDATSNLAKNKHIEDSVCDNSAAQQSALVRDHALSMESPILSNNDNVKDPVNLGSDSDSILSGVEGVDDNFMFSSSSRNRRNDKILKNEQLSDSQSTQFVSNEIRTASEVYMNAPNYQENDSFGPLPRNSEGDLGRYKRIRRLKPSHDSEEEFSSDS